MADVTSGTYLDGFRRLGRPVRFALAGSFLFGFSVTGVYAVLLNLYLIRMGYSPAYLGTVNGIGLFAAAATAIPAAST